MLAELDGSCRTPIASYAELTGDGEIRLTSLVALPDGTSLHSDYREGSEPKALGKEAGEALKIKAGSEFFSALSDGS